MKYGILINPSESGKEATSYNVVIFNNDDDVKNWKGRVAPAFESEAEARTVANPLCGLALLKATEDLRKAEKAALAALDQDSPNQVNDENQENNPQKSDDETQASNSQKDDDETQASNSQKDDNQAKGKKEVTPKK